LASQRKVEPVIESEPTDGLGKMDLPIPEAMRDADCLRYLNLTPASVGATRSPSVVKMASRALTPRFFRPATQ